MNLVDLMFIPRNQFLLRLRRSENTIMVSTEHINRIFCKMHSTICKTINFSAIKLIISKSIFSYFESSKLPEVYLQKNNTKN